MFLVTAVYHFITIDTAIQFTFGNYQVPTATIRQRYPRSSCYVHRTGRSIHLHF